MNYYYGCCVVRGRLFHYITLPNTEDRFLIFSGSTSGISSFFPNSDFFPLNVKDRDKLDRLSRVGRFSATGAVQTGSSTSSTGVDVTIVLVYASVFSIVGDVLSPENTELTELSMRRAEGLAGTAFIEVDRLKVG